MKVRICLIVALLFGGAVIDNAMARGHGGYHASHGNHGSSRLFHSR